ncbi:hypothetical protein ACCO45_008819 [Purpureocillium lilacinum]|uniref:Uncharacterized protein n=1 Tax=Purpureocillium lilacinum TaxID=33203 RepID=A0ACC4DKY1_PURLI
MSEIARTGVCDTGTVSDEARLLLRACAAQLPRLAAARRPRRERESSAELTGASSMGGNSPAQLEGHPRGTHGTTARRKALRLTATGRETGAQLTTSASGEAKTAAVLAHVVSHHALQKKIIPPRLLSAAPGRRAVRRGTRRWTGSRRRYSGRTCRPSWGGRGPGEATDEWEGGGGPDHPHAPHRVPGHPAMGFQRDESPSPPLLGWHSTCPVLYLVPHAGSADGQRYRTVPDWAKSPLQQQLPVEFQVPCQRAAAKPGATAKWPPASGFGLRLRLPLFSYPSAVLFVSCLVQWSNIFRFPHTSHGHPISTGPVFRLFLSTTPRRDLLALTARNGCFCTAAGNPEHPETGRQCQDNDVKRGPRAEVLDTCGTRGQVQYPVQYPDPQRSTDRDHDLSRIASLPQKAPAEQFAGSCAHVARFRAILAPWIGGRHPSHPTRLQVVKLNLGWCPANDGRPHHTHTATQTHLDARQFPPLTMARLFEALQSFPGMFLGASLAPASTTLWDLGLAAAALGSMLA